MKKILIIAGPNGAGKTTFAQEFLPTEACCPKFVNADLIAAGLSPFQPDEVAFAAARIMLKRMDELVVAKKTFAFETTLSSRIYLKMIPRWQQQGYKVKLYFLKLPNSETAIRRVEQRVSQGGHAIPPSTIRRRVNRGWKNLHSDYLKLVDKWGIYDSCCDPVELIKTGRNNSPDKIMEDPPSYLPAPKKKDKVKPLDDPDFIGAEAAFKRATEKAIARAHAYGLKPIIAEPEAHAENP